MTITHSVVTTIPNTPEGREYAEKFIKQLKEDLNYMGGSEDTVNIYVHSKYFIEVTE